MSIAHVAPPPTRPGPPLTPEPERRPLAAAKADWLLPLGLVVICVLFFHRVVFGGEVFPWDFVSWNYPFQRYIGESLRAGEWPLWNPRTMLGSPIMGDPQTNIYNPLFLLYHLLPGLPLMQPNTLAILETAYIALAGVSAYFLARHFRLSPPASFLAGLVFMLAGFLPIHVQHTAWVIATAWLPLFFLLVARLLERFQFRVLLGLALVTMLSIFAGYPQATLWSLYLALAYFAWWMLPHLRQRHFRPVVLSGLALGSALALGAALAAIQVLPLLEFTLLSSRGSANFAGSLLGGLEPGAGLTLLFPKVFGSDGSFVYLGREVTQTQKYLGLLPLVLTLVGAGLACRRKWSAPLGREAHFFLGLTLIAFWGSLGAGYGLYRILEVLPLISLFRRASTLFPFALLGMAMLSGLAFEHLVRAPARAAPSRAEAGARRPFRLGSGPAVLALWLVLLLCALYALGGAWPAALQIALALGTNNPLQAVAAPAFAPTLGHVSRVMLLFAMVLGLLLAGLRLSARWRGVFVAALLAFTAFDLYWFNAGQIFSINSVDPLENVARLPLDATGVEGLGSDRLAFDRDVPPNNLALYAGVEEAGGYNPLQLRRVNEYLSALPSLNVPGFDLLNVRYLVLTKAYHEPGQDPDTFAEVMRRSATKIYLPEEQLDPQAFVLRTTSYFQWFELWENEQVRPRFFASNEHRVVPAAAERLALLGQPGFDPGQTILLEQALGEPLGGRLQGPVQIAAYARNSFELQAEVADGSTLLFMSVPQHPGWRATVDGQPARVLVANHAFMALVLPPGAHVVRMAFQPRSFYAGLALSSLAVAVCAGLALLRGLRLRRAAAQRLRGPSL